jgi:hypothetical protein
MKITVFWDIAPYNVIEADRRFVSDVLTAYIIRAMK